MVRSRKIDEAISISLAVMFLTAVGVCVSALTGFALRVFALCAGITL